jgi:hypothetical protein
MNVQREIWKETATGIAVFDEPADLSAFLRTGCAAALWQRQLSPKLQAWIDKLDPGKLPSTRIILKPQEARDFIAELFEESELPAGPEQDMLVADVARLTQIFSDFLDPPYLRVRLDVVTTDACRKFHIDAVTARLVCTYRGTGTQYGISSDGVEPDRVFTVPTGAPILLRGTLWTDNHPLKLLHRSPPIEGTGETRLVLVLDPVEDPKEDI